MKADARNVQPLTREAGAFVATVSYDKLSPRAREAAQLGFTDAIAVMIAGAAEDAARLVSAIVNEPSARADALEIPGGRKLSAEDAALVNGTAAHALDYDDVGIDGHPSAVLVPAILALSEAANASGRDAIAAYVAGYEVWARLQEGFGAALHERGFHPTAVWGSLATAAACANLLRLDAEYTAKALALGASLAGGLVANFGTMTKPFHAGRAAQAGVMAARLVQAGFTAATDALEHPAGFIQAVLATAPHEFGACDWSPGNWRAETIGINVKLYPTCYATHRTIDGIRDLRHEHNVALDDVAEIRVHTGATQMLMLRNHNPCTGLEAKFSMQFAAICALDRGQVTLAELTDGFVDRDELRRHYPKVKCTTTDERMADLPFAPADLVSLVMKDGRELKHAPVSDARGSWVLGVEDEDLRRKFLDCTRSALGEAQASELFARLTGLDAEARLADLPLRQPAAITVRAFSSEACHRA